MKLPAWIPWRSLVVAAVALALAAAPGALPLLVLDRGGVLAGEWWRLLTGHLVHFTTYHMTWDVLALVGLGFLFERELGRRWWSLLLTSSVVVAIGTLVLAPGLDQYSGLSGVLNGLWVGGAIHAARVESGRGQPALRWLYLSCVIAGLAKTVLEAVSGTPLFTDASALGGVPVPLAHALGSLAGAAWSLSQAPSCGGRLPWFVSPVQRPSTG